MTLTSGTRLGPYEITDTLGSGGMGEVYRARDTRLNRDVAIKVLPELFASDPERLARFEREAQTLAALNHPNIAQIYGVVDLPGGTGSHALVMECVDGEDLAQRIARGPIPLDEALPIARQIADALEAAHEKGIIHRDLKPANIKVAADGSVKVLDFGLAKAIEPAMPGSIENSPTFTSPALMTRMGVILGTAAYMSPEQARGRTADRRSDMWAFGVVLFEMLTGRQMFAGETVTDVLAAIVTKEPDWSALPPSTPDAIRRLLRRCLARDPKRRLGDAGEARWQIEEALATPVVEPAAAPLPRMRGPRVAWILLLTSAAVAAALTSAIWWRFGEKAAEQIRYSVEPEPKTTVNLVSRPAISLSPDGKMLAFIASAAGVSRIYVRKQDAFESRALEGTEGASEPVFSPDGRWIAFFANNTLSRVPLEGGPSERLAKVQDPRGLSWDAIDTITYTPEAVGPVLQVSSSGGGAPTAVTAMSGDDRTHRWAQALPGNKAVLFTVGTLASPDNYDNARIEAVVLATKERRVLIRGASFARYVEPGYLVFMRGPTAYAVRFDAGRLQVGGPPVPVVQGIAGDVTTGAAHFAVSHTGAFAYVHGATDTELHRVVWVDRTGRLDPVDLPPGAYFDMKISPDGKRVAIQQVGGGGSDIWIYDFIRKSYTRLTFGQTNRTPIWSPDGSTLYWVVLNPYGTDCSVMRRPADGSAAAQVVATSKASIFLQKLGADDTKAFVDYSTGTTSSAKTDIGIIPLRRDAIPHPIIATPFDEYSSSPSPDGRWIAYQSDESSRFEIYVSDASGHGGRWQISTQGGEEPRWSADGRELYFRNDTAFMAVSVDTSGTFQAGTPTLLFEGVYNMRTESGISYDVDSKNNRFLMYRLTEAAATPPAIRVITNWSAELK